MSIRERKVINYLMQGPIQFNQVGRIIDMNLLIEAMLPDYKPIARTIRDYFSRYKSPPTYELLKDSLLEDLDYIELAEIIESTPCPEGEYAYQVDKIKTRYQAYLAKNLAESILSSDEADVEDLSTSIIKIGAKVDRLNRNTIFSEGNFSDTAEDRLKSYKYVEENPGEVSGVLTGYCEVDNYIWGIKKQELMIIAGASSSGKSMLMLNIAINAWLGTNDPLSGQVTKTDGANILYFTLEMSREQTEQRMDACIAAIEHKHLVRGMLTEQEKDRWKHSLKFQSKYDKRFYIVDIPRGSKMTDVEARYDTIIAEFQPDLVCIDYLGIMQPNTTNSSDWLDLGDRKSVV